MSMLLSKAGTVILMQKEKNKFSVMLQMKMATECYRYHVS